MAEVGVTADVDAFDFENAIVDYNFAESYKIVRSIHSIYLINLEKIT